MSKSDIREKFKKAVFERDNYQCVVCKEPAVDAHHIIDRSLFEDGGYHIDNGASLCSYCHVMAEDCLFTVEHIRACAGIVNKIVPEQLYSYVKYNKWGDAIINDVPVTDYTMKYPRSLHYSFSEGTTSDDRINHNWWNDVVDIPTIVHTEKLDGEGSAISKYGNFARSHALPTTNPWAWKIKERWDIIKNDLGDYIIYGENMYAVHSIEYKKLPSDFFVFSVRCLDKWLSWEETKFIAEFFDLCVVPELQFQNDIGIKSDYENNIKALMSKQSVFDSYDIHTNSECSMEGIVSRNIDEYTVDDFSTNLFKIVRKGHVKTGDTQHWTRNWKKANISYQL